jgi:hypothetical protein
MVWFSTINSRTKESLGSRKPGESGMKPIFMLFETRALLHKSCVHNVNADLSQGLRPVLRRFGICRNHNALPICVASEQGLTEGALFNFQYLVRLRRGASLNKITYRFYITRILCTFPCARWPDSRKWSRSCAKPKSFLAVPV